MSETEILDVRTLIPIKRHEKLLALFAALPKGESFTFTNDHDPKPLYYEFRSIHGDVVGWDYLKTDPTEWTVRVTRTEDSQARALEGVATLIDLRKTDPKDWKHTVFHRFGMMTPGTTMELIAHEEPLAIRNAFGENHTGKYTWTLYKQEEDATVIHLYKRTAEERSAKDIAIIEEFDVRPHPPARRHEMVYEAFDRIGSKQAFVFTNDHDPKPLYYQFEAESTVPFVWEYLEEGPEVWRVKVGKR